LRRRELRPNRCGDDRRDTLSRIGVPEGSGRHGRKTRSGWRSPGARSGATPRM
jgi:hypothetical protein